MSQTPVSVQTPVLIVDDDENIRFAMSTFLRWEGYRVEVAENGAEGLDLVERVHPWVVLLDMRMPVLDGWGFARGLEARGIKLPLVVMTAASNAQLWCTEVHATVCLPKPFDLDDLLGAVERVAGLPPAAEPT
jgi:two-component system chemotaxis response regulator CheY